MFILFLERLKLNNMNTKKFVKEIIELTYDSCKNNMWDYMDGLDCDAIDAIYEDIKDKLSIEVD